MTTKTQNQVSRVAVLVGTSTQWGRQLVSGIQSYARMHGPWFTFIEPRAVEEPMSLPKGWDGDGVIARISTNRMARELQALKCPVVNVSGITLSGPEFPSVTTDHRISGQMAAEYFRERGYKQVAYFSLTGLPFVRVQQNAFAVAARHAGMAYSLFAVRPQHGTEPDWNLNLNTLGTWLQSLPKPVAILAWNTSSSRELLYAAHVNGIRVPEDMAVLCGTDDDFFCTSSFIPLSGIRVPAEQTGLNAAALLDRLMQGQKLPRNKILLEPLGIITRQSTDTIAIDDPALAKALCFIRENGDRNIRVTDVVRSAGISRRILEVKFKNFLTRSPADEIRRMHIERAKHLLEHTDHPIPVVADRSGFGSPEHFVYMFNRAVKLTPLKYRKHIRCR
jgi:LacI family transcriptional regulator